MLHCRMYGNSPVTWIVPSNHLLGSRGVDNWHSSLKAKSSRRLPQNRGTGAPSHCCQMCRKKRRKGKGQQGANCREKVALRGTTENDSTQVGVNWGRLGSDDQLASVFSVLFDIGKLFVWNIALEWSCKPNTLENFSMSLY